LGQYIQKRLVAIFFERFLAKELTQLMLEPNPKLRCTAKEALNHPFLNSDFNSLETPSLFLAQENLAEIYDHKTNKEELTCTPLLVKRHSSTKRAIQRHTPETACCSKLSFSDEDEEIIIV
jgi:serine/threonine protein kinase